MHLHRRLGDADIVCDLFVEATRHDMEHDLTLAGAERVETLPEQGQCPFTVPASTVASKAGLDSVKKILITERLCEELYRTALHRLHSHRHVGMRCNEDDRHLPVCGGKVALKLKTASSWHSDVKHEAGGALRRIGLEKIVNRRKLPGMQANRPQEPRDRVAKLGIVIDDQDTGICVTHPRYPKGSALFPLWLLYYVQSLGL